MPNVGSGVIAAERGEFMDRVGLSFSGGLNPPDIVDCIQLADELGYESAWMAEGHGGDQFSILTACALRTKNIPVSYTHLTLPTKA